jgi:hypothetical protein
MIKLEGARSGKAGGRSVWKAKKMSALFSVSLLQSGRGSSLVGVYTQSDSVS